MTSLALSRPAARALLLAVQGIESPNLHSPTREGVLEVIERMGMLQIDTIHVVARSPYFVLWSRLGSYEPIWLDELLAEGAIFEAWSHEASFLPRADFPHARARMLAPTRRQLHTAAYLAEHRESADRIINLIRENGPMRSADFEHTPGSRGPWWDWKPEKHLLEALFAEGSLMVAQRDRFQRVYDLRERVMPEWDDALTPSHEETVRALVLRSVEALGVATSPWIADYYRFARKPVDAALQSLVASGELMSVTIEDVPGMAYLHPANSDLAKAAARNELEPSRTVFLSPFDPIVWDRRRGEELFDFIYRIECYTPAPKRRYGYFSLPILHRGALVGRLDAKAHRRQGIFEVKSLHLEPGVKSSKELATAIAGALRDCATWHQTPEITIVQTDPPVFAKRLLTALR
jgi:uncharacterized protein